MGEQPRGWAGLAQDDWASLPAVRAALAAGADPNSGPEWQPPPIHMAAEFGSPRVVEELAARVDDVDLMDWNRTALWRAVQARKPHNAKALLAAGANPVLPMMSGWSPARLSLVTRHVIPSDEVLTAEEQALIADRDRMIAALAEAPPWPGFSITCVGGVDADEAARRLEARVVPDGENTELAVAVTDVPGGCVVMQPSYFNASTPFVMSRLSAGTVAYGMYANAASGDKGSAYRDGEVVGSDLYPGGEAGDRDDSRAVLIAQLYPGKAVACCFAYALLRPDNCRWLTEPDRWLLLPDRDHWRA